LRLLPRGSCPYAGYAEQPPPPCHPNLHANEDMAEVRTRGDIVNCPSAQATTRSTCRPAAQPATHTGLRRSSFQHGSFQAQAEPALSSITCWTQPALSPIRLRLPSPVSNEHGHADRYGPDCRLPLSALCGSFWSQAGLPTDPNDVGAFIDIFTDHLWAFRDHNESGWYEGWMIHDLRVAPVAAPLPSGRPQFGTITAPRGCSCSDGEITTTLRGNLHGRRQGGALPERHDHFSGPSEQHIPIQLSMGA